MSGYKPLLAIATILLAGALTACDSVDDDRIPPAAVWLGFITSADWQTYGVAGATSYQTYIKPLRQPASFPYTAMDETGYGGLLLVSDILGDPVAYDLSCPVEREPNVRVHVDTQLNVAKCNTCGSTYDIFANYGNPLSGPAAERKYALRQYHVGPAQTSGYYMLVTR